MTRIEEINELVNVFKENEVELTTRALLSITNIIYSNENAGSVFESMKPLFSSVFNNIERSDEHDVV